MTAWSGAAVDRRGRLRGDDGTVTAELALGLVAVTLVLAALLVTTAAASARMRCLDAARTAARVAALGVADGEVVAAAQRVVPGARVTLVRDPPWMEVTVTTDVGGAWFTGGSLAASGSATAWAEP
ncbi:TadE family type IV pilus minor pilin [Actinotalea fermentans]|uniref:Uncharacterized protein n=1 Tax=Actinotalea fermentans TaxID=43671 RepID=A0A511YY41_9CELL|nr:TadE family type IV pilus minor pilin [Actinotalea fermentans]KGM14634.1 hypothetical protein N867_18785 [Actinotalea fermentans ATCC 43279 = JCM 9966 = DSM 3133]GEN80107.1 hypothetical protein AFE02nite_18410 [Actinotalea fermentans]